MDGICLLEVDAIPQLLELMLVEVIIQRVGKYLLLKAVADHVI